MGMYRMANGSWWFSGSLQWPYENKAHNYNPATGFGGEQMIFQVLDAYRGSPMQVTQTSKPDTSGFNPTHLSFTDE